MIKNIILLYNKMRLIRLTSTSSDGIMENNFQAEILLKENSQIALDSLTMEVSPTEIKIDDKNDTITFSIEVGESLADKTITITHGTYGGATVGNRTYEQLLAEIQFNMMKTLSTYTDAGTGKMLGSEYKVFYNDDGKTEIAVAQAPHTLITSTQTGNWVLSNITVSSDGLTIRRGPTGTPGDLDSYMYQPIRLARGGGMAQVRVGVSTPGSDETDSGFIFGVSRTNPALWAGATLASLEDIAWGVQFVDEDTAYQIIEDGTLIVSGDSPVGVGGAPGTNDLIQIGQMYNTDDKTTEFAVSVIQDGGDITVLTDGEGTPSRPGPISVEADETYYAVLIMLGSNDDAVAGACSASDIITFTDPYDERTNAIPATEHKEKGTNEGLIQQEKQVQIYYNFQEFSLQNFLGYLNLKSGNLGYTTLRTYISFYPAFASSDTVDNFIFELLNLDLESYDGFTEQRQNYLSTIPSTATTGNVVSYKTSYPIFLNLSNKKPFTLRNIMARILSFGNRPLQTRGQTTATILIKDSDDR